MSAGDRRVFAFFFAAMIFLLRALMIGSNNAWNVTLYNNLRFNFTCDIATVASIYRVSSEVRPARGNVDNMPLIASRWLSARQI
jgi:hypothetical protein